jgi:hypothetical protein
MRAQSMPCSAVVRFDAEADGELCANFCLRSVTKVTAPRPVVLDTLATGQLDGRVAILA